MSHSLKSTPMTWQVGQWVECQATQEKGSIHSITDLALCITLAEGITLYISPDALDQFGWTLMG